jgi:N-methylhydantoinase B
VPDGVPLRVTVAIDPSDARIEVDLRDNVDCQPCGLNLTEATSLTAAMVGVFNGLDHTVPANGGSFRRLSVLLRENCIVGIPRPPTSCSVATTNIVDRVANAVQRGLAELAEGVGLAEVGLSFPASVGVVSGHDPRAGGAPFVNQLILAWTGGPGGPDADGWLTFGGVGDGGALLRDSVEVDEIHHPIRVLAQRIVPDTEGAGRHRGAPSAFLEFGPVDTSMELMYLSDGSINPAQGARGGHPGSVAQQYRRRLDGSLEPTDPCGHVVLEPGEMMLSYSCGGGGYGDPRERDPARVATDVAEGFVTPARAEAVYGVALDQDGRLDEARTRSLRAR